MPVPIPYAMSYTATAGGATLKIVSCDNCGRAFAYLMQRTGIGEGTSWLFLDKAGAQERALESAARNLEQTLAKDFDALPCPHCGKYQTDMLGRIRWERWQESPLWWVGFLVLGAILFGLCYLFSINNSPNPDVPLMKRISLIGAIAACVLGIGWFITISVRWFRYDPNNPLELDERMTLARARTAAGPEIDQIVKDAREKLIHGPNSRV